LQQASKAIEGLGVFSLEEGVISTRHLVHTTDGKVIGEWGMRKWMQSKISKANIHIARQSLRFALLEQLGGHDKIKWGHQLVDLKKSRAKLLNLALKWRGQNCQGRSCGWSRWYSQLSAKVAHW
jgi:hypothetical protein